jgi:hypothetical protein
LDPPCHPPGYDVSESVFFGVASEALGFASFYSVPALFPDPRSPESPS